MSGRTATVAALLAALLLARCPACSSTVSSPGAPPAREHESYFEGWGEGYDADDGPRAALANAAQIAADVDPSPVEDDIDALDQPAAKLEVREVRWEDEEATRSKLGRAEFPDGDGDGFRSVYPLTPTPGVDDVSTPITTEEWFRRPRVPPTPVRRRGGLSDPPSGTLGWDPSARAALEAELRRLQFPASCDDAAVLAVPLEMCPLGCRVHIFLQRALIASVTLGRTLVPLPPWDAGLDHLFQPVTNCSLRPGQKGATEGARRELGEAMEALTDLFILSGAPHEKLEPLEASYRGDKKNPARAVDGWLAGLRELMREQHASEQFLGDEHWNKNSPRWKRAAATLAPYTVGRASVKDDGDVAEANDIIVCSNGRCDNAATARGACVRPEGCPGIGLNNDQFPDVLWRIMRNPAAGDAPGFWLSNQPEGEPAPIEYSPMPEDAARIIEAFDDQRASVAGEVQAMLRGDDEEEPGRGLLPLPGYPYPRAVSVPELPPRITVFPPGSFADGCNDWPSACQPHFALHAMLTSWILTRPLAAVAGFITPATFRNLDRIAHPVVTLQVRRSDKMGEDPFYNIHEGYRDLATYVRALDDAATATGKCFKTVFLMTDAKHAVLELRRMHAAGNLTVCGEKPALVFSDAIAADREYSVPVFVDSLVGRRGNESAVEAVRRERLFAAELWVAAKFSDYVVGDASSNVFMLLLEAVAARKGIADIPRLVSWAPGEEHHDHVARCPRHDPVTHRCYWMSSIGASLQEGWHSVLLANPWVNGESRAVRYAMREGPEGVERLLGKRTERER